MLRSEFKSLLILARLKRILPFLLTWKSAEKYHKKICKAKLTQGTFYSEKNDVTYESNPLGIFIYMSRHTHSANFDKKVHKPQSIRTLAVTKVKKQVMQKNKIPYSREH